MVLLYNFRLSKVGKNQISNVYMPFLNRNAFDYIRLLLFDFFVGESSALKDLPTIAIFLMDA